MQTVSNSFIKLNTIFEKRNLNQIENKKKGKSSKKTKRLFDISEDKKEFLLPEQAEVSIAMAPVSTNDLAFIKYTDDFQSFVDISLIAFIIYLITEMYMAFVNNNTNEINLSLVWCSMALIYGMHSLLSIAINYLRSSESSLLFVFASLSFVCSLVIQLADTKFFSFHLLDAYRNVTTSTINAISNVTLKGNESTSNNETLTSSRLYNHLKTFSTDELLFSCFIAMLSSLVGGLLVFPSFRLARLHLLCIRYSPSISIKKIFFYISFVLPLMISLCFLTVPKRSSKLSLNSTQIEDDDEKNSVVNKFLNSITPTEPAAMTSNVTLTSTVSWFIFSNSKTILLSPNLVVYLVVSLVIVRFILYRFYAQAYLNLALEYATQLRKNKCTNLQYMQTISSIYQYYGVVANQYILPCVILLFSTLLLKTTANIKWCSTSGLTSDSDLSICDQLINTISDTIGLPTSRTLPPTIVINKMTILNDIFTSYVMKSLLGYSIFWIAFSWFSISTFGLFYYQYIERMPILDT
jgi:hypothetical protein